MKKKGPFYYAMHGTALLRRDGGWRQAGVGESFGETGNVVN